ncbi:MAG: ROK family protein [Verrucomicrobia bacterium]|nr:ROK family protein [Verrucomicrobiota bacterium]
MKVLGIDVGGSGIKGAVVNIKTGKLVTDRIRYETPQPATPKAIANTIAKISGEFTWNGSIGVGFPAVIKKNKALTATNISNSWVGTDAVKVISRATGRPTIVLNDADAAALAELKYGRRNLNSGMVIFITVGTGLGTALLIDGHLVPNTELGHLYLKKMGYSECYCSNEARKRNHLTWKTWAGRFNTYLEYLDYLFHPDQFVIGGGISKTPEQFVPYLKLKTPVRMASLKNEAGIIGAAWAAYERVKNKGRGKIR